jgi:hypothetical protein
MGKLDGKVDRRYDVVKREHGRIDVPPSARSHARGRTT